MRKTPTRKRPYFKKESAMTAILRDASGKMNHGILFDPPLSLCRGFRFISKDTLHLQLMKMSRLVVTTLSLQTCVFISSVFAAGNIASHTGVFRGPRISSLVGREEMRAPLNTPAWEATGDRDSYKDTKSREEKERND